MGAYVCAEAETVQRVRAALLDSGRLKPHGVTRFDARVWRALDEDGHLPIPTDPDAAEWAVHVFGLPHGRPEDDAVAALIDSGAVRYVPGVRIGSPACYVHLGDKRADRDRDRDPGRRPDDTSSPSSGSLGVFIPAATSAESTAESARRVDAEARARPGGRVQPPKWAPPDDHPTFARFTFSELFAGVGGFGAALRDLGGEATFASESCPHARRTYVVNHGCGAGTGAPGDGPLVVGDITDVCEEIIPPHDVLTGGFPCQSFSARGQRRGLDDPRGALYREILRTLVACRPRAFLLENVEGLATMDDGEVLDVIVADLRAAGYDVETKIIDAAGWVPQSRRRVFSSASASTTPEDDENVRRPWTTTADSRAARRSGSSAASRFRWPTRTRTRGGTVRDVLEDECGNDADGGVRSFRTPDASRGAILSPTRRGDERDVSRGGSGRGGANAGGVVPQEFRVQRRARGAGGGASSATEVLHRQGGGEAAGVPGVVRVGPGSRTSRARKLGGGAARARHRGGDVARARGGRDEPRGTKREGEGGAPNLRVTFSRKEMPAVVVYHIHNTRVYMTDNVQPSNPKTTSNKESNPIENQRRSADCPT